jgi:hypothetical protein
MGVFDPTAGQTDFAQVPGLPEAWEKFINERFQRNIAAATSELASNGLSAADLRFYNPLVRPVPAGSTPDNVFWPALPTSFDSQFGGDENALFAYLDSPQPDGGRLSRIQDEYNEWTVMKNNQGKITKIIFTSEPPEYYQFLWDDPYQVGQEKTRRLLLKLYRERCENKLVKLTDLAEGGNYNWYNKWNNQYCVHMQQRNNTLSAQVNIAARSSIVRRGRNGQVITDARVLIDCAKYGDPRRQSDPSIGYAANLFVRQNRFITLQNPVGLYMTGLDTAGWSTPDDTDPQKFWNVVKGVKNADHTKAMIARAEFAVPAGKKYTVSEIEIGGIPIRFGAEVAAHIEMRLGVLKSKPVNGPLPGAAGCV